MALITWSNMLSTGIDEQDAQHKKLIELINQLNDAMQAGHGTDVLGKVLSELVNYTVFHFGYEEKLMDQYGYADSPTHKAEHVKFVQTVGDFKKKFDSGNAVVSVEIMNFLRDWLTNHIMKTDKKLGQTLGTLGVK
ncbi:MAG: bacteriohemerythrin [Nitrospirae bacterium]|nr:bacteriohemerythrin [Nitrospirota bacterium]MCL5284579.1 bacteriohemerythrin [Nitrospirota bacterium]